AEGKPLPFFGGDSLKEKYVVRVNELVPYLQKKGTEINCDFMLHKRYEDIQSICEKGAVPSLGLDLGMVGSADDLKVRLPVWMQGSKEDFIKNLNQFSPIPQVYVFTTRRADGSLNPTPGQKSNAILSVASLSLTESDASGEVFNKKAIMPRE